MGYYLRRAQYLGVEHSFNEGGIFEDFEGFTDKFKFLHDFVGVVEFHDITSTSNSELGHILSDGLCTQNTSILRSEVTVKYGNTEIVLWCIFQESNVGY